MQNNAIKGIVFDLDGVMIDSEAISIEVWRNILKTFNVELTNEDYGEIIGMSSVPAADYIIKQTGAPVELHETIDLHWDELIAAIQNHGKAEAGLMNILDAFAALSLPLAVASNSPSYYVHSVLKALEVDDRFETVTCADEISHSKPQGFRKH
jgi:beta-phosphoglucomutase-like phosphatase (HAD superfamily)